MMDAGIGLRAGRGAHIRLGTGADGIERLEARFQGQAFSLHRHDTYAIGITLSGIQTFYYRGTRWQCLPGQPHVLHPDETHDGAAGSADGFSYRIVYVDPALVQQALGGRPLPFVSRPVLSSELFDEVGALEIWDIDADIDEIARVELVVAMTNLLERAASDGRVREARTLDLRGLSRARECIAARPHERQSLRALEAVSGLDRWTLARQFRAAYGTSPSRFRTLRQLDRVRTLLKRGVTPADAALAAGFADQSHMSRRFKQAYGLTPARWAAALV